MERKLGLNPGGSTTFDVDIPLAGKKRRLDDSEYVEQSQEIIDSVRSAVSSGEWPF